MWTSKVSPDPGPVEGVDNLPIPAGTNRKALRQAEEDSEATPGAMGVPMSSDGYSPSCNGDNPNVSSKIDFANGTDQRNFEQRGPKSNPFPGKVGA